MKKISTIVVPCDVPSNYDAEYVSNYQAVTHHTDNLIMFVCDHKLEHMHDDFLHITQEMQDPEHLFKLANNKHIGAFATHLGLIARYAKQYQDINYIVKINGKTNVKKNGPTDPVSTQLWSVHDVINFKKQSGLKIRGVGISLYLGSDHEPLMLKETAQAIFQAHQHGLLAIVWMYVCGSNIRQETTPEYIIGAAGVAASLGADFVKLKMPEVNGAESTADLLKAAHAAGTTKVICAGGSYQDLKSLLQSVYNQIHLGNSYGVAIGRNLFQRNIQAGEQLINALDGIINKAMDVESALHAALEAR